MEDQLEQAVTIAIQGGDASVQQQVSCAVVFAFRLSLTF